MANPYAEIAPKLNDEEIRIIRFLHSHFEQTPDEFVEWRNIPGYDDTSLNKWQTMQLKLKELELVPPNARLQYFRVSLNIRSMIDALDNPPKPNYWKESTEWYFSKPWSVPVTLIVVFVPILQGWAASIKWLFSWFGAAE